MEVLLAKTAGFCFGVKRAVDTVYEQVGKGNVYTYGPIIHNEEVVKDLESKGVALVHNEDEIRALESGLIVIRSHGVEKRIYDVIKEKSLELVDATCPFVKKIHNKNILQKIKICQSVKKRIVLNITILDFLEFFYI